MSTNSQRLRVGSRRVPVLLAGTAVLGMTVALPLVADDGAPGRDVHNLAPNLSTAFEATYELSVASLQSIELMESAETTGADMDAVLSIELINAPPDPEAGAVVELRFDRIAVRFEGQGALDGEFDSSTPEQDDDPADPLAGAIRPMIDTPVTLTLSADGTIENVDGLADLAPEGTAGFIFTQLFNDDVLASMVQPIFSVRPLGEDEFFETGPAGEVEIMVGVGETWSIEDDGLAPLGLPAASIELTLDRLDEKSAEQLAVVAIEGVPTAEMPDRARSLPTKEIERSVTGEVFWSLDNGLLHSLATESKTIFETEGGFALKVVVEATTELERVK